MSVSVPSVTEYCLDRPTTRPRRPQVTVQSDDAILLTVIIPVFNEAATIEILLGRVLTVPLAKQILVVDDGSTDGTAALLEKWQGHSEVELLRHARNRGKGAAIRTALNHA